MRSHFALTLGLLLVVPFSVQAQTNKHEKSIANHGYSIPIIVHDTPALTQPGSTLRDDVEKGIVPPVEAAPAMNVTPQETNAPKLPPAMPPAIAPSDLENDVDQMMEKKTLTSEPSQKISPSSNFSHEILLKNALKKGDTAKDFTLMNVKGEVFDFYKNLEKGPIVLIWYRGGWCPYCNIQLKAFQDKLATIEAAGAQLVAISPERPDNSLTTVQKNDLQFEVLSDANNGVAREYGLVYTAPEELKQKLPDLNLMEHNGTTTRELPLTATYVVETDGTIAYSFVKEDYKIRAQPSDVIAVLGDINARASIKKSRIRQAMEREAKKIDQKNKTLSPDHVVIPTAPVESIVPESVITPAIIEDAKDIEKEVQDEIGEKIEEIEKTASRIEKLEDKTTIKRATDIGTRADLKPIVTAPAEGVEAQTTLEVRAKEEGLIPESY